MNNLICTICKNKFMAKRRDTKYCSETCKTRQETINRTEKKRKERQSINKRCEVCDSEFTASIYTPYQIYCSPVCLNHAMSRRAIESGRKREQYVKHKDRYAEQKSEAHREYNDRMRFSSNKKHVLDRDGHKCTDCGKKKGLIVHHIDGSGSFETPNNDMDNLVTLCRSCHMRHHAGEKNHQFIHITKEQVLDARKESFSWEETARKLNVTRQTLIKRRKMLGIF